MVTATATNDRQAFIQTAETEVHRWNDYVETLLRAFHGRDDTPPNLHSKLEALRNKRDTVVTKVTALKHHRASGWTSARRDLKNARRELLDSWRSVISAIDRESLFV